MKFSTTYFFVFLFMIGSITRAYAEDIEIVAELKSHYIFKNDFLEANICIKKSSDILILGISSDKGSIQKKLQGQSTYQLLYKDTVTYTPQSITRKICIKVLYQIKERVLKKVFNITYTFIEPLINECNDTLIIYRNCENAFRTWYPDTLSQEQKINFYTIRSNGVNINYNRHNELIIEASLTNKTFTLEMYRDSILVSKKAGVILEFPHPVWRYCLDNNYSLKEVFVNTQRIRTFIEPGAGFKNYFPHDSRYYLIEYIFMIKRNGVIISEERHCPNELIQGSKTINLTNLQSGDQLIFKCLDVIRKNYQNKFFVAENPEDLVLIVH